MASRFVEVEEHDRSDSESDLEIQIINDTEYLRTFDENDKNGRNIDSISTNSTIELTSGISTLHGHTNDNSIDQDNTEPAKHLDALFNEALNKEENSCFESSRFHFPKASQPMKVEVPFKPFQNYSKKVETDDPNLVSDSFGRIVEKKYSRCHWYSKNSGNFGANFFVMSGNRIDTGARSAPIFSVADRMKTLVNKYARNVNQDLETVMGRRMKWEFDQPPPHQEVDWLIQWTADKLNCLETLDFQKRVCATLNSRTTMRWLIGIENNKVKGCLMNRTDRDMIANAFAYSMTREFVPDLDPNLITFKFNIVSGGQKETFDEQGNFRAVIEIAVLKKTNTIYQLSSGRCFYLQEGVIRCENIEKVRNLCAKGNEILHTSSKETMVRVAIGVLIGSVGGYIVARLLLRNGSIK